MRKEGKIVEKTEIYETLKRVLEKIGAEEEIVPEASLMDDLGLESLQIYEMLADLEAALKIKIPERVLMRVETVQDMEQEIYRIMREG